MAERSIASLFAKKTVEMETEIKRGPLVDSAKVMSDQEIRFEAYIRDGR